MRLTIPPEAAGERLDVALASALGSRAAAQRAIDAGRVLVDGRPQPKRFTVRGGETVEVEDALAAAPDTGAPADFAIAYEDEHLLVVDKPAGVVVHPARGHWTGTLAQALAARGAAGGEADRPGIVHRLDPHTSGPLGGGPPQEAPPRRQPGHPDPPRT